MNIDITISLSDYIFRKIKSKFNVGADVCVYNTVHNAIDSFMKDKICIIHDIEDINKAMRLAGINESSISEEEKISLLKNKVLSTYENIDSIIWKSIISIVVEDELQ